MHPAILRIQLELSLVRKFRRFANILEVSVQIHPRLFLPNPSLPVFFCFFQDLDSSLPIQTLLCLLGLFSKYQSPLPIFDYFVFFLNDFLIEVIRIARWQP